MRLSLGFCAAGALSAESVDRNATSKVFVAAVEGEAFIQIGDRVQPLEAKSAYSTSGVAIETRAGATVSLVFSNGMGVTLESSTRVEVKRFTQEPFRPDRTDMDVEPSISQAQLAVAFGTAIISTSTPVAGSSLNVFTPHGTVSIHGGTLVIAATDVATKVEVLSGVSSVFGGQGDANFRVVRSGEAAVAHSTVPGRPEAGVEIQVNVIPPPQLNTLTDQASSASLAKKQVYFDEKPTAPVPTTGRTPPPTSTTDTTSRVASNDTAPAPTITAFDANAAPDPASNPTATRQIIPVPVVPQDVPIKFTVSPAIIVGRITTGGPGG